MITRQWAMVRVGLMAAAWALMARPISTVAAETSSHAPLQPSVMELVEQDADGALRLIETAFAPDGDGVIVLEVSKDDRVTTSVTQEQDLATLQQIEATAGTYFFRVNRSGIYHAALVAKFPWEGTWTTDFQYDGGLARQTVCNVTQQQAGSLHMLPMPDMRKGLHAGAHQLSVSIPGAGEIVAIVLQRGEAIEAAKVDAAPPANRFQPATGTVTFAPVRPIGLDAILGVEAPGSDGLIEWAVIDGQGAATPAPELDQLAEPGESLVLRATLHRDDAGQSAALRSPAVSYRVDPDKVVQLSNEQVLLEVDLETGRLGRLVHRASGRAIRRQAELPFRLLQWSDADQALVPMDPQRFVCEQVEQQGQSVTITYRDAGVADGRRTVTFTLALNGGQVLCSMSVDNQTSQQVRMVQFPYMSYVSTSDNPRDDQIAFAGRALGPVQSIPAWVKDYHTPELMYAALYGESIGFYIAAHDATGEADRMRMLPATGDPPYTYTIEANHAIEPGDRWSSQTHAVAVYEGDWHAAADLYRAWYTSIPRHAEDPDWLQSEDYVTSLNVHLTYGEAFATLVDWWKQTRWRGTFAMKVNGIGGDGFTNNFHPYPSPPSGGPDHLREAAQWVNAHGGQMDAYLNARYYTPSWGDGTLIGWTPRWRFPKDGTPFLMMDQQWTMDNALVQLDGTHYLGGGPHRPYQPVYLMSHRSKGWHAYWMHWLPYYAKLGMDVYWDQAMVSTFRDNLPQQHRQWPDLNYQQGLMRTTKEAVAEARRFKPDFVIRGEGLSDRMMRYLHLSFLFTHDSLTPVYRYTLPDQVLDYAVFNGDYDDYQRHGEDALLYHMRIVAGQGWGKGWGTDMRRLTYLRHATADVSLLGRYMDNLHLKGETDQQRARWVRLDQDGRQAVAINTVNRAEADGWTLSLKWPFDQAPRWAFAYTSGNHVRAVPFTFDDGTLRFTAPAERISTLVFIAREMEDRALRVQAITPMNVPGRDLVRVMLANASDRPATGQVRITPTQGVEAGQASYPVQLGPGEATVLDIAITGVSDLQDFIELPVVVATDRFSEVTTLAQVAPLLPNGSVELDELGDGTPDYWRPGVRIRNDDGDGYSLVVAAHPDFHVRRYIEAPLHLRPSTRYRITIRARGNTADAFATVVMRDQHKRDLESVVIRLPESDQWQQVTKEFTTTARTDAGFSAITIRCQDEKRRRGVWVDDVHVEMLGPAE